ncbi:thioredoxin-related transmembrane protein 4 [Bombina bombina]|uniref:thioredoxin-related transmembrane protein 4 n=1 Tax=Bombina bombina TaxID=8345 RepID=UPI00235AD5FD|nr:thioredoxin-related transmembrane protein 4 [Bombina bombina]
MVGDRSNKNRVAPSLVLFYNRQPSPVATCFVIAIILSKAVLGFGAQTGGYSDTVKTVSSSNWTAVLEGEWMIKFYAPWCPACQQIKSEWKNFGKQSSALNINVGKVDVTEEPGLSGRFFVTTLPTIYHAKDGVFRKYHGSRVVDDLQTFIVEKKWEIIEPIAGWKSPSSILMSGMAGLFHLSGWIRQMHTYLIVTLGIPAWGSYIIFILATLLIGLVLGLILVLLADCFCPSKVRYEVIRAEDHEKNMVLNEDPIVSSDEKKDLSDDDEGNNGTNESEEDSAENSAVEYSSDVEEEEEADQEEIDNLQKDQDYNHENEGNLSQEEQGTTPESESVLRQRRTEGTSD